MHGWLVFVRCFCLDVCFCLCYLQIRSATQVAPWFPVPIFPLVLVMDALSWQQFWCLWWWSTLGMWFFYSIHSHWHLVSYYNRTCTNGHLSETASLLCPGGQSIGWLLFKATKARPQLPKYPFDNGQFFSDWRKVKNGQDIWSVWRVDD